ncbi:MAG: MarR family transcriptional regulator [Deinococcales bacterium]
MQILQHGPTRRFLYGFWALRQRLFRHSGPVLKERHGLEMGDFFLLDRIAASDLSPTEIAAALEIPAHAISRRLDVLEKQGSIRRALDPRDARRRVLTLTEAGERRLERAAATMEHETEAFLGVLDACALDAFLDTLERLAKDRTP